MTEASTMRPGLVVSSRGCVPSSATADCMTLNKRLALGATFPLHL